MVRIFKQVVWLVLLALGVRNASGYALIGPYSPYQVPVIAYNLPGDLGGPMNLGEEFRRNLPVMYYTFDQNFTDYFGTNGIDAIEQAFTLMNGLTNVSSYSSNLTEFPQEATRVNYLAQALNLSDLKSVTMSLLAEEMGLAQPDRWTWCLHDRLVGPGGCPGDVQYTVIKRNFDPTISALNQYQPSSYVNGTLFSYLIVETCTGADPLADAYEFTVDPLATTFTAIASYGLLTGEFYTGMTRDDVGGLRYMYRTNNYNLEAAGVATSTYITNTTPQLLFTSNLTLFAAQALTNAPGALLALYPDLQIISSTPIFTNVVTTNTIFYFVNRPQDPAGTAAALVTATVVTTNVAIYWNHEFLNVFITPGYQIVSNTQIPFVPGHTSTNGQIIVWTTNISTSACSPYAPYNTICTNISAQAFLTNGVFGDYYILPTNICSVAIIATQLITAVTVTNATFTATNAPGTTNNVGESFDQTSTYTYNQYIYVVRPVQCPTNTVATRQGIERVQWVRRDFDSLVNRFFYPITNRYVLMAVTNNTLTPQYVERVVTAPDVLLTAQDLSSTTADPQIGSGSAARNLAYSTNGAGIGLTGPGTIDNQIQFTYEKVGPIYGNISPTTMDEATQIPLWFWGSFDGSTNLPVVYPNGTSIYNIENQVLIQVSPVGPNLPIAHIGVGYTNTFTVTGGTAPYVWSLSPGSPGLPTGLFLNSATGQITGTPVQLGIYDFSIRLTDATGRFVDRAYSITITL